MRIPQKMPPVHTPSSFKQTGNGLPFFSPGWFHQPKRTTTRCPRPPGVAEPSRRNSNSLSVPVGATSPPTRRADTMWKENVLASPETVPRYLIGSLSR